MRAPAMESVCGRIDAYKLDCHVEMLWGNTISRNVHGKATRYFPWLRPARETMREEIMEAHDGKNI